MVVSKLISFSVNIGGLKMVTGRVDLIGGAIIRDGHRYMVPIKSIKRFDDNPRDPVEFDYDNNQDFRNLVDSIRVNGGENHTAISVFWSRQHEHWQLIAGHRRLEAVIKANKLEIEEWDARKDLTADTKERDRPKEVDYIYANPRPEAVSDFDQYMMMFSEEETSKAWGDVRKFAFFRKMYEKAPPEVKNSHTELRKVTALPPSTINTYIEFINIPKIADTMGDPSTVDFERSGRMKLLRACVRGVELLLDERKLVVQQFIGSFSRPIPASDKEKLADKFLDKARLYTTMRKNRELAVGPGVALERSIPIIRQGDDGSKQVSDAEIVEWLEGKIKVLHKDRIEQTLRINSLEGPMASAFTQAAPPTRVSQSLSDEDILRIAQDAERTSALALEVSKKYRQALDTRLKQ